MSLPSQNLVRVLRLDGTVTTIAGSGSAGYVDGKGAAARFNSHSGVGELAAAIEVLTVDGAPISALR